MRVYHFCTYFDHQYLPRGLALYRSLERHSREFRLWALCLDQVAFEVLSRIRLPHFRPIALKDFEKGDHELQKAKRTRSLVEYYFTCTPSLPLYILKNNPEVDLITYLDSDVFFFASPSAIYEELAQRSIAITEHRYTPERRPIMEQYGLYNVGWLTFRRDAAGMSCLTWWRQRCLEWCYDRVERGLFADQKYLDDWPDRFPQVAVLRHKGVNTAPWNLANYNVRVKNRRVRIDEDRLIFFHFHGLKQIQDCIYDPNLALYRVKYSRPIIHDIYIPYIRALAEAVTQIAPLMTLSSPVQSRLLGARERMQPLGTAWLDWLTWKARREWLMIRHLFKREYIFVPEVPRIARCLLAGMTAGEWRRRKAFSAIGGE